jgi:hypothetical protein
MFGQAGLRHQLKRVTGGGPMGDEVRTDVRTEAFGKDAAAAVN